MVKVAFIGFGEAAGYLADGLREAGANVTATYDILIENPETAEAHRANAMGKGVTACTTARQAVQHADIIISAVVSKEILAAAENAAPHLQAGQIYLDINSASPRAKMETAECIEASGADFVESAVMDVVPRHGHKVPMLLAGRKSVELAEKLTGYGMNVRAVSNNIGDASSVKMVRSVFMKGFSAILLECLMAANKLGAEDAVLESLQVTYPQWNWKEHAEKSMTRLVKHAKRQSEEMLSVADTLEGLGIEPFTAMATSKRLGWLADQNLKETYGELPKNCTQLFQMISRSNS